jgi:hypothetical protein
VLLIRPIQIIWVDFKTRLKARLDVPENTIIPDE